MYKNYLGIQFCDLNKHDILQGCSKFALNAEFLDPLNYSWSNDKDLIEHEGPWPNAII